MIVLCVGAGCSGPETSEESAAAELSLAPALPYSVEFAFKDLEKAFPKPEEQALLEARLREDTRESFDELKVFRTFAEQPGSGDITVAISAVPVGAELPRSEQQSGLAVLNGFLWFLGGIPAWFIPDTRFDPLLQIDLQVHLAGDDVKSVFSTLDDPRIAPEQADLSFFARAGLADYAFQIVVPPPLLPPEVETARASLIERGSEAYSRSIAAAIKGRLVCALLMQNHTALVPLSETEYVLFVENNNSANAPAECAVDPGDGQLYPVIRERLQAWCPDCRQGTSDHATKLEEAIRRYQRVFRCPLPAGTADVRKVEVAIRSQIDGTSRTYRWSL